MGVRGLQTFFEHHCHGACYKVNIIELSQEFKKKHGIDPVIVVDGMSCIRYWYGELEWLPGGQWLEYLHRLRTFVEAFKKNHIHLVFFFDGCTADDKRTSWVNRRLHHMKEVEAIYEMINTQHQTIDPKLFQLPASMGLLTRFVLKYELKCEVHTALRDCDMEIAMYARDKNCFAILGQDSDYIIFDTIHNYFSVTHLNLNDLHTVIYDRRVLVKHLSLEVSQLPLLSCLLGNDYVPNKEVVEFHKYLCKDSMYRAHPRVEHVIPRAAKFIQKHTSGDVTAEDTVGIIAKYMFNSDPKKAHMLLDGVRSYIFTPPEDLFQVKFYVHPQT